MESKGVALVTGASRGIGRAIALALAQSAHYDVVINYARNAGAAEEVKRLILATGRRAQTVQGDIAIAADRQRLLDDTLLAFGHIDLLVNNAGIAPEVRADLLEATEASFDRLINVNLKGPYFLTQLVAREMIKAQPRGGSAAQSGHASAGSALSPTPRGNAPDSAAPSGALPRREGKIVTISSVSAYAASTNRGDYCVAKAGLAMMTKLFAARLAEHGINVYEIRPGVIATDMTGPVKEKYDKLIFEQDLTPIRRWGKPDDVASAVVAIACDRLPFSTGEVINVDGGFHLRRL